MDAQAATSVTNSPYTTYAKRPGIREYGHHYRVTDGGKIPAGLYRTSITIGRLAVGGVRTEVEHPYLQGPEPPNLPHWQFSQPAGYQFSCPLAVNHRNQVVGYCVFVGSGAWTQTLARALLWRQGRMYALETLPGYQITHAVAINDRGVIVGDATIDSFPASMDIPSHAICWISGKIRDLGTGWAIAVNNAGDIVGDSGAGPGDYYHDPHALLWTHGYWYDLNDCIPPHSGWLLSQGARIDDQGRITGYGTFHDQPRIFLLTPTSTEKP